MLANVAWFGGKLARPCATAAGGPTRPPSRTALSQAQLHYRIDVLTWTLRGSASAAGARAGVRRTAASVLGTTAANAAYGSHVQQRWISWNPAKWGRSSSDIGRQTSASVEEELPEIFASQPEEVDEYIRPDKSFFEKLEDFWDWAISFLSPVEKQLEIMRGLRNNGLFGFDFGGWGHVFVFYGLLLRLLTLVPSLYSNRNSLRMSYIGPQISEITNNQNRAKNDRTLSTAEKRVIKDGYNRMKYALYKKHGCAQWKSFMTMVTVPITMSAFLSIRRLAMYEDDLETAPFLWVKDLTMPDPTYLLPAICATMFLANFELNQKMQRGGRSSTTMYIRWAVRLGCVIGTYFFASQPSAMFAYWIGLSMAGLLQPILLRWQPFRDYFQFPDPPQSANVQMISEIRGPSLVERLFSSKAVKEQREAERQAQRAAQKNKTFQSIDSYEVVFEEEQEESSQSPKASRRK